MILNKYTVSGGNTVAHKAFLVGINYPGTNSALRGCVNDVMTMKEIIENHFGFTDPNNVKILTDNDATTRNIKSGLSWLIEGATAGDVLFFHFSGHGSQMPNNSGSDHEPDGLDEILCPTDLDWQSKVIRDDDLRRTFDLVPEGVSLTVLLDCCHSGSGLDQTNQYQPLGLGVARELEEEISKSMVNRYIPMPEHLRAEAEKYKIQDSIKPVARSVQERGMLITGCQSQQTSADAFIGGKFMGAATYFVAQVLKEFDYKVSYKTLVDEMNKRLAATGFTQRPELNGNIALFESKVLNVAEVLQPTEPSEEDPSKKKTCWLIELLNKIFKTG